MRSTQKLHYRSTENGLGRKVDIKDRALGRQTQVIFCRPKSQSSISNVKFKSKTLVDLIKFDLVKPPVWIRRICCKILWHLLISSLKSWNWTYCTFDFFILNETECLINLFKYPYCIDVTVMVRVVVFWTRKYIFIVTQIFNA